MNYKQETIKCYDLYALQLEQSYKEHFHRQVMPYADRFISQLSTGKNVLDLGSGPGHHASYFRDHGIDVLCADLSEKMVAFCHKKGLRAVVMDIEDICLPESYFDGVWAYTSLLHVPKAKMPGIASRIERILKPNGILAVAVKEGKGEGLETRKSLGGHKRWFSYYTESELQEIFGNFSLINSSKTQNNGITFLHLLMCSNKSKE